MILETGSGVPNANSYASTDESDNYADASFNTPWIRYTDDEKERRLILSSRFVDRMYNSQWIGIKKTEAQGLAWPRVGIRGAMTPLRLSQYGVYISGLTDSDGFSLEDRVPLKLKYAVFELSKTIDSTLQSAYPVIPVTNLKSETISVGSVTVSETYVDHSHIDPTRVVPAEIEDLLKELVFFSSSNISQVRRY